MSARAEEQRLLTEELHVKDLLLARHDADRQRQVEELGTTTGLVLSLEQQVPNSAQTYMTTLCTDSLHRERARAADITDRRASHRLRARTETLQPSTTKSAGRTPAGSLNQHLQNLRTPRTSRSSHSVYVCMYVCMYVYMYIYTHTHLSLIHI